MNEPKLIRYNGQWKQDEYADWYYYEDVDQILENRDKLIKQLQAELTEHEKGILANEVVQKQADQIVDLKAERNTMINKTVNLILTILIFLTAVTLTFFIVKAFHART